MTNAHASVNAGFWFEEMSANGGDFSRTLYSLFIRCIVPSGAPTGGEPVRAVAHGLVGAELSNRRELRSEIRELQAGKKT
jgi:hypothetical protein